MPNYKPLILLLLFIGLFFCCKAQDTKKYVYQDSSVQQTDSIKVQAQDNTDNTSANDTTVTTTTTESVLPDTVLQLNSLRLSPDSIAALKNAPPFAYAKNLDSLLKTAKKEGRQEKQQQARKGDSKESEEQQDEARNNSPGWLAKFLLSPITRLILWTAVIAFILFLLYKLFFAQGSFIKARDIRSSSVNNIPETETNTASADYNKLIVQAVYNKDYRLATRYYYLYTLQNLAANGLVRLEAEKTNYQYINELNNTTYRDSFVSLTLNYEYAWYGEFLLTEETFAVLKNKFEQFNNRLKNK